jgi:hypothetical protein
VTGQVKEDGSFVLTTYDQGDGAPAGTYRVTLGADTLNLLTKVPECPPLEVKIEKSDEILEVNLVATG